MQNAKCTVASKMERSGRHTVVDKYQMKGLPKVMQYLLDLPGFKEISEVPLDVGNDFAINAENARKLVDRSKWYNEPFSVHFEWDHECFEGHMCQKFRCELGKLLYPRLSQALDPSHVNNHSAQKDIYVNLIETDRREANRFSHPTMKKFSDYV